MDENRTGTATTDIFQLSFQRRKKLLPWWVKVFCWLFLIAGAFATLGLIFGAFGTDFELSVYGLETNKPLSLIGVIIISIFIFKAVAAYGLLYEKNWAVTVAIIDAIIGIVICVLIMFYPLVTQNESLNFTFRLELVALVPYLVLLFKIRRKWQTPLQI